MTVQVIENSDALAEAEVFDFRSPATLTRDQSRALELGFETFARQWGTQLTAKLRVVSRVSLQSVAMASYDDYTSSLPPHSAMTLCTIPGFVARAVVQLPTPDALTWVGRMLGGAGLLTPPARAFTTVEHAIVRRLLEESLEELSYSFGPLLPSGLTIEAIHYTAQFAQAATPTDIMIVASFSIRVGDHETQATLAMPATAVLSNLGKLEEKVSSEQSDEHLRSQLAATPVALVARFSPLTVRPGAVLDLTVGDILRLPHPQFRPLDVAVGGETVAHAAVGSTGSRLACVVVDTEES